MRIDISEIKEFRMCHRKWLYSSRNRYHLIPFETPKALNFGTIFHECLHMLYRGTPIEDVYGVIEERLTDPTENRMMLNMISGYYAQNMCNDLAENEILAIEFGWTKLIQLGNQEVTMCGSIDMITLNRTDQKIYGWEHKTTKAFKEPLFIKLDEQFRTYYNIMPLYIAEYNKSHGTAYEFGGIILNEVRKLIKQYDDKREILTYKDADMERFNHSMQTIIRDMLCHIDSNSTPAPEVNIMKCAMCQYKPICEQYGYGDVNIDQILLDFPQQYQVRLVDHLDAKAGRDEE